MKKQINFENDILSNFIPTKIINFDYTSIDLLFQDFESIEVFQESHKYEKYCGSLSITKEQIEDLRVYNIDIELEIQKQLYNEFEIQQKNLFLNNINKLSEKNIKYNLFDKILKFLLKIIKKKYIKYIKIKSSKQLLNKLLDESALIIQDSKKGSDIFIIVSPKIGIYLQNNQYYQMLEKKDRKKSIFSLYKIGKIANLNVYVNPQMGYNDSIIYIGRNIKKNEPGIIRVYNKKETYIKTKKTHAGLNNISLNTKMYLGPIGKRAYLNYRKLNIKLKI